MGLSPSLLATGTQPAFSWVARRRAVPAASMAESNQVKCPKMQTFTDSTGREWTVFEVRRQGVDRDGWSYVPEGFGSGWLCFESSGLKRRLSPVPDNWRTASRAELMQM